MCVSRRMLAREKSGHVVSQDDLEAVDQHAQFEAFLGQRVKLGLVLIVHVVDQLQVVDEGNCLVHPRLVVEKRLEPLQGLDLFQVFKGVRRRSGADDMDGKRTGQVAVDVVKMPADGRVRLEEFDRVGLDTDLKNADQQKNRRCGQDRQAGFLVSDVESDDPPQKGVHDTVHPAVAPGGPPGQGKKRQDRREKGHQQHQQADHAEAGKQGKFPDGHDPVDTERADPHQGGRHGQKGGKGHVGEYPEDRVPGGDHRGGLRLRAHGHRGSLCRRDARAAA